MRRSEGIRSLETRAVRLRELDANVLDLLVDGDSSFAALFLGLRHHWGQTEVDVAEVFGVLAQLAERQLVRVTQMEPDGSFRDAVAADLENAKREYGLWLPHATYSEVAVDEVGLWYQVTERGRGAWSVWSGRSRGDRECWVLDDHADRGILEVRAGRKEVAEAALSRWLAEHEDVQIVPGSRESVEIPEFVMRDGVRVVDGVLVTCRYRTEIP